MDKTIKLTQDRLFIAGDSHGRINLLEKQLKAMNAEHFLYTGDFYSDAKRIAHHLGISFDGVIGNCDPITADSIEELRLEWQGKKIYLVHGHLFDVKRNLNRLFYKASSIKADIVIFGHTHMPMVEVIDGILFINPGSLSQPRQGAKPSFIILENRENIITPEIITLE